MPELPEVEIVRQSLNKKIIQKTIKKVIVRNRNLRVKLPLNFKKFLEKRKILNVDRFSKYLIFFLSGKNKLLIHLGMSGTIHLLKHGKENFLTNTSFYNSPKLPDKHNHIEIFFDKFRLVYNDPRKFGFVDIVKTKNLQIAYVGDVVGTGSSRKSAANSMLWHMGDDIPCVPAKRTGGFCFGNKIRRA